MPSPPDRLSHRGEIILSACGCLRLISRQATRWLRDLPAALIILGAAVGDAPSLIEVEGRRLLVSVIDHTATGGRCLLLEECRAVQLTACEIEILHWVDQGKSNEQIAQIRRVKVSTVKSISNTSSRNSESITAPPPPPSCANYTAERKIKLEAPHSARSGSLHFCSRALRLTSSPF